MLRTIWLAGILVFGAAAPALADSSMCSDPIAPAAVDGSTATEAQMHAAHDDVVNFLHASDEYQQCLFQDLNQQKMAAAKAKKPFDDAIETAVGTRVDANQKLKERVGGEYNAAAHAYQAKHPN